MRPVFTVVSHLAAGRAIAAQRSLCRPTGATSARDKQTFFCWTQFVGLNLQDNIPACSDRTCVSPASAPAARDNPSASGGGSTLTGAQGLLARGAETQDASSWSAVELPSYRSCRTTFASGDGPRQWPSISGEGATATARVGLVGAAGGRRQRARWHWRRFRSRAPERRGRGYCSS
jgi:hypothetical protein